MNPNLLKAFVAAVDENSFSKAAERLFISQPALSQNIKQLENQFSVTLIKRTPHGHTLTEAGNILYKHAVNILAAYDAMKEDMDAFRASLNETLLVGATSVVGGFAVPCSIFLFKQKYPEATIKLRIGNRRQILSQLRDDSIDIAVVEGAKPDEAFVANEIHTEEMVVIAAKKARWKAGACLGLDEFCKAPLIIREEGSATRDTVEQTLRQANLTLRDLNIVMELYSVESIKAAVEAGHGISILPRLAVKKELYNKTLIPVQIDTLSFLQPIYIAHKKKKRPPVATEFIKLMKSSTKGFC